MAFGESANASEDDGRNVQREDRKLWQERINENISNKWIQSDEASNCDKFVEVLNFVWQFFGSYM